MTLIILFLLCGLLTGILGGMLGIGGGVITVPALYFLFRYTSMFEMKQMQIAAATSLAISFLISLASSIVQYRKKAILFPALKFLSFGLIIGCILGACLAEFISSEWLRHIFGGAALCLGLYFTIPALPQFHFAQKLGYSLSLFGVGIGTLSSLLGIGGGILTFPTLLGYNVEPKISSGTSSAATALSSLLGTLAYLYIASVPSFPGLIGYIDLNAFFLIGIAALLTTPLGVRLSHTCNTRVIKRIFGICLTLIGFTMIAL